MSVQPNHNHLHITWLSVPALTPFERRTRRHPKSQIRKIARAIESFGLLLPIIVDGENRIIDGEAVLEAAKSLGYEQVPVICLEMLDETQARLLRLALNRLAEEGRFELEALGLEFKDLLEIETHLDLTISGFEVGEIDQAMDIDADRGDPAADVLPTLDDRLPRRCAPGQLWALGEHRLFIGDARDPVSSLLLLDGVAVRQVLTDPPYNVPIEGFAGGKGQTRHGDFAMASGEMTPEQFTTFLTEALRPAVGAAQEGTLFYVFMDWRHMEELQAAARALGLTPYNLCVWVKPNGGMGSHYRSQHELCFLFKKGTAPPLNTVQLGRHGRNRSNVWQHAGFSGFRKNRELLDLHPTVKPVALLADALLDASAPGEWVLDPFAGTGSTLIAAEKTGRRCAALEIDPRYGDVILARYQALTGQDPVLIACALPKPQTDGGQS